MVIAMSLCNLYGLSLNSIFFATYFILRVSNCEISVLACSILRDLAYSSATPAYFCMTVGTMCVCAFSFTAYDVFRSSLSPVPFVGH
jgi:hypothetical protein